MAGITIPDLDDSLKRQLRIRAAEHGRTMQDEAMAIPCHAIRERAAPKKLGEVIPKSRPAPGG